MKLGIIGFPGCGKTTLFNVVTNSNYPMGQFDATPHTLQAIVRVPDPRLERLREMYHPRSFVPAAVDCVDFTGLITGTGPSGGKEVKAEIMGKLREADAIVHVVRAFESEKVPHVLETVDPLRDLGETNSELLFADLVQCEARLIKLRHQMKTPSRVHEQERKELATLEKLFPLLEAGQPVSAFQTVQDDEKRHVAAFQFLTAKKQVVVINVGDHDLGPGGRAEQLTAQVPNSIALDAELELEISQLAPEERGEFLKEMGITEPAAALLARKAYATLDAISFFTVGEDEVRAWTIRHGETALTAAAKVHTDLAKGFVRAEVFAYQDLITVGDEKGLKAAGKLRVEGREYVVQDGEIVHIRANTR